MAYPELTRRVAFAAALESAPGTAATPTMAANAVRLLESTQPEEFYLNENLTDDIVTGRLGVLTMAAPGGRCYRVRGRAVVVPVGSAMTSTNLPEIDPLLIAGGMVRTLTAEVRDASNNITTPASVAYEFTDDPSTGANSTITAIMQVDGKQYRITNGVLEAFQLTCDAGGFPILEFTLVGIAASPTEQALEAAGYKNVNFPIWKGAGSLSVGGATSMKPQSFSYDAGLTAAPLADANAADAVSGYRVTGRVPAIMVKASVPSLADWDPRADWNARTGRAITATFGAAAQLYHKVEVKADDCRVIGVTTADEGSFRSYDVTYRVTMPTGASKETVITFK